jgi:hypothetical protein
MLRAVHRTRQRNRRGAVVELRRARLSNRVATLVELRRQKCLDPRRIYLLRGGVVRRLIVRDGAFGGGEDGLEHCGTLPSTALPEPDAPAPRHLCSQGRCGGYSPLCIIDIDGVHIPAVRERCTPSVAGRRRRERLPWSAPSRLPAKTEAGGKLQPCEFPARSVAMVSHSTTSRASSDAGDRVSLPIASTAYCPYQRRERGERHDADDDPRPPPPPPRAWLAQQVVERAVLGSIESLHGPHLRALGRQVRALGG